MTEPQLNSVLCGNIFDVLPTIPDKFVNLSITSPPYNKGKKNKGWLTDKVVYAANSDDIPEDLYQQKQIELLDEMYRITKPTGHFFYNHKLRWVTGSLIHPMKWISETKWTIRQEIVWNRTMASNIRGWRFWQVDERIYWLQKEIGPGKELESKDALLSSVWNIKPEMDNDHPAPFPLVIPARIIMAILKRKGIVFDPYAGSGTTLVAAKLLGHNYFGVDISSEYVAMAEKRLIECERERSIVDMEQAKHVVTKTYKQRKAEGMWDHKMKKRPEPKSETAPPAAAAAPNIDMLRVDNENF